MADTFINKSGLQYIWNRLKTKVNTYLSFSSTGRKAMFTNGNAGEMVDIQNIDANKSSIYILANNLQTTNYLPTESAMQAADANLQTQIGTLTDLTTDNKDDLVKAINEVYEKSGEPFRVKQWASANLNVTIPTCTTDVSNTQIPKMVFSIDAEEGASYQIVGMIAYEVSDANTGGNRINCWPVCQFTGNGQKELSVRWMCGGTTPKTAQRINAWVLLKHR